MKKLGTRSNNFDWLDNSQNKFHALSVNSPKMSKSAVMHINIKTLTMRLDTHLVVE
jgi:hypothetical protein